MILLNVTREGDKPNETKTRDVSQETNLRAFLPDPSTNPTSQDILSQMQSLLDKLKLESSGRNILECTTVR